MAVLFSWANMLEVLGPFMFYSLDRLTRGEYERSLLIEGLYCCLLAPWAIVSRPFADRLLCFSAASGVSVADSLLVPASVAGFDYLSPLEASLLLGALCMFVGFCFLFLGTIIYW